MTDLTYYQFSKAISGYFEYPTDEIRNILPSHLQPVELRPAVGIFTVIIFEGLRSVPTTPGINSNRW